MVKLVAIGTLALAGSQASAQSRWCFSFEPSSAEVSEVLALANDQIGSGARLYAACYTEANELTGINSLTLVRTSRYSFAWPANEALSGVPFYRSVRCVRAGDAEPNCGDAEIVARWKGSFVRLGAGTTRIEITEVLKSTEHLFGENDAIEFVNRTYASSRSQRFPRIRRFELWAMTDEGRFSYRVVAECSNAASCQWQLEESGRIYD